MIKISSGKRTSLYKKQFIPLKSKGNLAIGMAISKNHLNFVTLSWDYSSNYGEKDTFSDLINDTLCHLDKNILGDTDFLLCAGRSVKITKGFPKESKRALSLTQGNPIIFEVFKSKDIKQWCVLFKRGSKICLDTIRTFQIIGEASQLDSRKNLRSLNQATKILSKVLKRDEGLFYFKNQDIRLQLLICGENNFVKERKSQSKNSLFVTGNPLNRIPNFCKDEKWVLLNPSHAPYKQVRAGGGANYDRIGKKRPAGPVVGGLVKRANAYHDGTYPPTTVIHVNNYRSSNNWSKRQAARVFTKRKGLRPEKHISEIKGENFIIRKFSIKIQSSG